MFRRFKKGVFISVLGLGALAPLGRQTFAEDLAFPLQTSEAYQRYARSPRSDLAKLLCLIGQFWNSDFQVIYNGTTYPANTAVQCARLYLFKNYKGDPPEPWIKSHVSKSLEGETIYLKYPDGERRPVAEVLLEQLRFLNRIESGQGLR